LTNLIGALHEDIFACLFNTHGPNQHSGNKKDTVTEQSACHSTLKTK